MKLSIEEQTFLLKAMQEVKEHKEREAEEIRQELERVKNKLKELTDTPDGMIGTEGDEDNF
jgi:hypothetical protein